MEIAVFANDQQWNELQSGAIISDCVRVHSQSNYAGNADAFLVLEKGDFAISSTSKPVILNSVSISLHEMNAPANVVRINAWNSFIKRLKWEIAGEVSTGIEQVLASLGKQKITVADEPGLVAAKIISMIINEAYFALGEMISTKEEIDIAMQLGTNYPYGPFEWASIIGKEKILELLFKLSEKESKYLPAPLLKLEVSI
jgi:3-hydroxybutyryl-CoA dehydrogenase